MEKKTSFNDIELSPLRSLDDFLLESARFQIPNVKDLDKWGNRVMNNMLYYQTNYILMGLVIFLVVSLMHPLQMLCGTIAMAVAFSVFFYATNSKPSAVQFKKNHPFLGMFFILGSIYFIVYMLGSLVVCIFGLLLPLTVMFIHASMRLRNMKNKLVNRIDTLTMRKTPMGMLLEALGSRREGQL